jgi:hypothetical protein
MNKEHVLNTVNCSTHSLRDAQNEQESILLKRPRGTAVAGGQTTAGLLRRAPAQILSITILSLQLQMVVAKTEVQQKTSCANLLAASWRR